MTRRTHRLIASALAAAALAGLVPAASSAPPDAGAPAQREASPVSLFVEGPDGKDVRLVFAPATGWKMSEGADRSDGSLAQVALHAPAPADEDLTTATEPLSVFIDGPTGFVYVWNGDSAKWTFIGHVTDRRR